MKFLTAGKHHSKRELLFDFLDDGKTMVHIDSRREGVDVPPQHRGDPHLRLNFSYAFHLPHFEITEEAIEAELGFGGVRYLCIIPWDAVFAMTSHTVQIGYMWQDDLPPELAAHGMNGPPVPIQPKPEIKPVPGHPKLGVIRGGHAAPEPAPKPVPVPNVAERPAVKPTPSPMPVSPGMSLRPNAGPTPVSIKEATEAAKAEAEKAVTAAKNATTKDDDDDDPTPPEGGRRYGHLRVVK